MRLPLIVCNSPSNFSMILGPSVMRFISRTIPDCHSRDALTCAPLALSYPLAVVPPRVPLQVWAQAQERLREFLALALALVLPVALPLPLPRGQARPPGLLRKHAQQRQR